MKNKTYRSYKYKLANDYPNVDFKLSTVDVIHQKSLNYFVKFWCSPNGEYDTKQVRNFLSKLRLEMWNNPTGMLMTTFIVNLSYPEVHVGKGDYFVQGEFTFFKRNDFKSGEITEYFNDLSKVLYTKFFEGNEQISKKQRKYESNL
jgi:hypothetical protein